MNEEDEKYDDDNNNIITDENNNFINSLQKSNLLVSDGGIFNALVNSFSNKLIKLKKNKIFYPEQMTTTSIFQQPFDENIYPMNTYPRGKLVILNYSKFLQSSSLHNYPRNGSEKDVERLKYVFLKLGFIVELFENMTTSETMAIITESASNSNEKLSCYFLAILSHGKENEFFTADGTLQLTKMAALFQKSKLAGIPKIFLIQACRGFLPMESYDGYEKTKYEESSSRYNFVSLPTEEDVVYAFATAFGFRSFRNTTKGSWFIQTMCDVIVENASKMDFLRMLTKVNAKISLRKSKTIDDLCKTKSQIGSFVSHLTKELYFYPPHAF